MPSPLCHNSTFMLLRFSLSGLRCFFCSWASPHLAKELLGYLHNHDIPLFILAEAIRSQEFQEGGPVINIYRPPTVKFFSFLVAEPVFAGFGHRAVKALKSDSLAASAQRSPNLFDVVIILFGIATQFNFHL